MAKYRFKETNAKAGTEQQGAVEIKKGLLSINPWALVICLLLAIVFWLNATVSPSDAPDTDDTQPVSTAAADPDNTAS